MTKKSTQQNPTKTKKCAEKQTVKRTIIKKHVQILEPKAALERTYLTLDRQSWIDLKQVSESEGLSLDEFEGLWSMKPENKATIVICGKQIECPRYTRNYLAEYIFSGIQHKVSPMPPVLERLLAYSRQTSPNLNQCLVNWYEATGSIGRHADDEKQIVKGSDIHSWTFGPAERFFVLDSKDGTRKIKVKVGHNTLVVMGGKTQETYFHQVPKKTTLGAAENERRINVTFREFSLPK